MRRGWLLAVGGDNFVTARGKTRKKWVFVIKVAFIGPKFSKKKNFRGGDKLPFLALKGGGNFSCRLGEGSRKSELRG